MIGHDMKSLMPLVATCRLLCSLFWERVENLPCST